MAAISLSIWRYEVCYSSGVTLARCQVALCALGCLLWASSVVHGQAPGTASSSRQTSSQDDEDAQDARFRPAEPSYRLVNLPTTLRLPRHRSNFDMIHRFNGNLRRGSFGEQAGNLFGLDQGASIGIEYRYGIARHVQAIVYRTNIDKTFQFSGKYDAARQSASMPLSISAQVSVEGADNFQERRSPSLALTVSRSFRDSIALHASPIWVHNSAALLGGDQDTVFVGLGGRVRVRRTVYVVGEVSPRVNGYAPGKAEFGFGIEKRAGRHVFQLNIANSQASTFGQLARGGFSDSLYLGFNLARKFY
ncbi:MAG: DUF5777 family beta-barrel protein [Vicinamibacterales bacterium]